MRRLLASAGAIIVTCIAAQPATADRFYMEYDGSAYGILPLGRATIDLSMTGATYQADASIRSGGLAALFDNTNLVARSEGDVTAQGVFWRRFALDHSYARKHRVTEMQLTPNGVDATITPPHRDPEEIRPTAAQKLGARDPLASIAAMAAQVGRSGDCAGTFPTFDGRFRYDLTLRVEGRDTHRGGGYDGPVLKCKLRYRPVAGYRTPRDFQRRIPEGEIWFALLPDADIAPPVRLTAPLPLGRAGIRLRAFRRAEVAIEYGAAEQAPAAPPD